MSTYCRITGKSRGLPKPNYFPLLPPISPADAKRLCRITGKSYGLPSHHYIPVLVVAKPQKAPCHITAKSEGLENHHFVTGIKHTILKEFRYVFPVLETNSDLQQILENKATDLTDNKYVYTVHERRCSLVFPGKLEAAVRDGDVRDIMLAKHNDTLLLKLRKGGSVEVDVKEMNVDGMELYEGEGPSNEVLQKRKKRKTHDANDWRRKIFEDKERQAESEEERISEIKSKRIKVKLESIKETPSTCIWNNVREGLLEFCANPEFDSTIGKMISNLTNQELNELVNIEGSPVVTILPQCLKFESEFIDLSTSIPGIIQQPFTTGEQIIGFPIAAVIVPFQPFLAETDPLLDHEIEQLNTNKSQLQEILQKQTHIRTQAANLPFIADIPALVKQLETLVGKENQTETESGVKLNLDSVEKYIAGQFFETPSGRVFVPGNVMETSMGPCFIPGFLLDTPNGDKFLPGRIISDTFIAGQMALTRDGQKFVQGQTVSTKEGVKFIPGQTVITPEGVKFVPGQVIKTSADNVKFIPGQTIMTAEGPQFIPGQFTQSNDETTFIAGQSVLNENYNWEFIPGKNMKTDDGYVFVPGKEITNKEGVSQFVPGRIVVDHDNVEQFIPGLTVNDGETLRFMPGMQIDTPDGIKFIEGLILKNQDSLSFAAGKVFNNEDNLEFTSAKNQDEIILHDILSNFGMCLDSTANANETEVFGHMIQSAQGVEFFPGDASGLPAGKVIPGRLIKGKEIRFIPGTMIDNKFTPGQFVTTGTEEKFIPGQVIETNEGPKFVPGQVLQTRSGPKFVPGQTMETEDGPKFIPGQIIETKSGPTFIPGQVIYTEEEGSRFVPGQVVDTAEGPRFVPGRVVETGDHVTFIPGQVVETEDGLKFVAPDLEDDLEGGYQFTVQGFEVAQEELKMIQRNSIPYACFVGEMAIDSKTLQQFAEAGMAVGRQLPVDVPVVNIKSIPLTEVACQVANRVDLDALYSVKLSHILSNLQQIKQSNVLIPSEDINDENFKMLLNLALECDNTSEFLETLGYALENTIKSDLPNKLQIIDSLHAISVDLAVKVCDKNPAKILSDAARKVANKIDIDNLHSLKLTNILSNLQQIKQSHMTITSEELDNITDENLKTLLNLALISDDPVEFSETLGNALEQILKTNLNDKLQIIDTLQDLSADLSTKVCDKKPSKALVDLAFQVASKVKVDHTQSAKITHILSNLQQVKQSNIPIANEEINDEKLKTLVNLALQCTNTQEFLETVGKALEQAITSENGNKLQTIDILNTLAADLAVKVYDKKAIKVLNEMARQVANKIDIDPLCSMKLSHILSNLQKIKKSNITLTNEELNDTTKMILNLASEYDDTPEFLETFGNALEKLIKSNPDQKLHIIESLHSVSVNLIHKIKDTSKAFNEMALQVANKVDVDSVHSLKLRHVLSNLQQIKQSNVAIGNEEIYDENLKKILNVAVECDNSTNFLETISNALEEIIKSNPESKLHIIDSLHALSEDLAVKMKDKKSKRAFTEMASQIAHKVDVDNVHSAKLGHILANLQQIKKCNIPFEDIEDENLKILVNLAMECDTTTEFLDAVGNALETTIKSNSNDKFNLIDCLHTSTVDLLEKAGEKKSSKALQEVAKNVARKIKVNEVNSVKLVNILSNLQQIKHSNPAIQIEIENIQDENFKTLLNLALECDDSEFLETLSNALEQTIKSDSGNKLKLIDSLHALSATLATKVCDKEPNKILSEVACKVAKSIDVDSAQKTKLTNILSNLQHIMKFNDIGFIDIENERLKGLLNLAVECKSYSEFSEIIGPAIEKIIKSDPDNKLRVIDSLHDSSVEIVNKISEENQTKAFTTMGKKVAEKMQVDSLHATKLTNIMSNLKQLKKSNISLADIETNDNNLKSLLQIALECDIDDLPETLATALEKAVGKAKNKLDVIDSLQSSSIDLISKTNSKQTAAIKKAQKVAKKLQISDLEAAKLTNILTNLQQIKYSEAALDKSDISKINNDDFQNVLSIALENDSTLDFSETVGSALEALLQSNPNKSEVIDTLHALSVGLAVKTAEKAQQKILPQMAEILAKKMHLDKSQSAKLTNIMSNLQQIKCSKIPISAEDIKKISDKKFKTLLTSTLKSTNPEDFTESICNVLEQIIQSDPEKAGELVDTLHNLTTDFSVKLFDSAEAKILNESVRKIAKEVQVDGVHSIKLTNILSNLQQIKNIDPSTIDLGNIEDENLKLLVTQALELTSRPLEKLSQVLEQVIKSDLNNKFELIDSLHSMSAEFILKTNHEESNPAVTEMVNRISDKIEINPAQTLKLCHILSNLQLIKESGINISNGEIKDKNLKKLVKLASQCTGAEFLETMGKALEQVLEANGLEKDQTIDTLHALAIDLTIRVKDKQKAKKLEQTVSKMAQTIEVDDVNSGKLNNIISNIMHIQQYNKALNIENIKDEGLKTLIKSALESNKSQILETVGTTLEDIITSDIGNKLQVIDKLHTLSSELAFQVRQESSQQETTKAASQLAGKINVDEIQTTKLGHILSNLQHLKQSNVISSSEIAEKNLKKLFILSQESEPTELLEILSETLEQMLSDSDKIQIIDELHAASAQLAVKANEKSALKARNKKVKKLSEKVNIDEIQSAKLNQILINLQDIKGSNMPIALENIENENLKILLNLAKESKNSTEFLETIGDTIEQTLLSNAENKIPLIDSLHALTSDLAIQVRDTQYSKANNAMAKKIAKRVNVGRIHFTKLNQVLSNLQQIKDSNPIMEDIEDENLKILIHLTSECDNPSELLQSLGDAIEKFIQQNPSNKLQIIDSLHASAVNLVTKTRNEKATKAITKMVKKIVQNVDLDPTNSVKLNHILSNLQQIQQTDIDIEIKNPNLKTLLILVSECKQSELLETLGSNLEKLIAADPKNKSKIIDSLHASTVDLAIKIREDKASQVVTKIAQQVSNSVQLDPISSLKLKQILSNVQKIKQSNVSINNTEISNENLKTLLNLALECNNPSELLETLGNALQHVIQSDLKNKSQLIDALHMSSVDLAVKLSDKKSDKALTQMARQIADKTEIDTLHSVKLGHILSNLQQIVQSNVDISNDEIKDKNLKTLMNLASECENNTEFLETLGKALEQAINSDPDKLKLIDSLHTSTVDLAVKVRNKKPSKILLLKSMIKGNVEPKHVVIDKLISILNDHETAVCAAFQHMCQENPEFVDKVLENTANMLKGVKNEKEAVETLHRAIIKAVTETSESKVQKALNNKESDDFNLLVKDAVGLAKALGLGEAVTILNDVLKDRNSMKILAKDAIVMEVLKRLTVMRQLAETRPSLGKALKELHSDPYAARSDPRLRELVRESAMLMVIPEESLILRSSADIPSSILFSDNSLAVEDFMVKTRQCGATFLILKKGLQAVIPREAARDVLTGRVPYTVLDENGIHYFKPLHVFNALKLPKFATNRFSNYTYIHPALLNEDSGSYTRGSSTSVENSRKNSPNRNSNHEGMEEEFVLVKDFITDDEEFYADKGERVKVLKTDDDDPTLKMEIEVSKKVQKRMLLDSSTARYKMSIRPPKKHCDSRRRDGSPNPGIQGLLVQIYDDPARSGLIPMDYLKKVPPSRTHTPDSALHGRSRRQEAKFNREVCIGELIETEEEFGKDISRVVENYLTPLEEELRPAPRAVMDNKEIIFNNLRQISAFHNGVMIAGVKYFLKEPKTIGRTLLRLERDFDKHAEYVKNEPDAQELLEKNDEIRDYFEDLCQELGDDKTLADHLKLPIQRINDYTLLLQELIKYSKILGEDITDLERALELMLWIPTRCNDLKFITNIEGFHGNIHKLGRLIRHNWFLVKDKNSTRGRERYCFLFKARLLICKVRRISEDRCVFVLKEIIKLPEVEFKNIPTDKRSFEIHHKEGEYRYFPYTFVAHEDEVKPDWLREIQEHAKDPLTLAEHAADDLKLQSQADEDLFEPLKGIELDISPDIEQGLDPIEKRLAHKPLKHVPEPKRPPLEIPKKRAPIFTCVDPSPSPEREPEPVPEPEPEPEMISSYHYEEYTVKEEVYVETVEEPEEEIEEVIEFTGKRKPKYIPGVSKPLFHSTIRGSSNEPGENAVFECEVEGVTNMAWLKDNRPLSDRLADRILITHENNVFRLEIKNVCESDSGTYTARAENDQGVSFSTAQLIVEKLSDEEKKARAKATSPVFLVQLKDAELLESTHARFLVKVNGNPMPEVQFYKGDQLITADNEHIEIIKDEAHPGFYEMVIPEVRPEDAGEYKCVASNKYSDESCSCIVTVTNEKDIFAGLQEDLSGGIPKFMWLKNGKPFSPEERFKVIYKDEEDSLALVFQNVKPEDAGLYTCVASTSHGKISCSAELTIQGTIKEVEKLPKKAKIESITKTFEGTVGSTSVIEVRATGDPLPTIRWFKDGEEIVSTGRFKVLYEDETEAASMVIKNTTLEDSGEYNIVAKNSAGSDSQFVTFTAKAPPKIVKKLEDFTGLTGKELRLTIQVEASPKPIVQWYKDGMMIKKSNRIKYVTDEASDSYTLVIENAEMEDAGLYSVVASNEFCQVSDACHLSMESPPQFIGALTKELETVEGDYVSFSVMVEGDPLPQVKWKFKGKEIENDGKHYKISSEGAVFTLLISEVNREDAGAYSCEISNQWGSNECEGQLFVKCLPRFEKELEDLKVKEGDMDVEFTVKINAFPKATVKWFHDETEISSKKKEYTIIEEGDSYKLIIKEATTKMTGVYKCRAENEIGYKETSASLSVNTYPKFKKELSDVEVKEGESVKLTIQCQGVPEPEVKWYKDGEELYSDSRIKISRDAKRIENYHLTITLVKSEDGGEYEVRATNEMGTAVTRSLVTVLASTNHTTCSPNEEQKILNGEDESEKTEKIQDSKIQEQVNDEVVVKLPIRKKPNEKSNEPETSKGEKIPLRKRLSSEATEEEGFTVRELRSEEFVASTELKASSFGLVEEPPDNVHYIKINISRGVSIVSMSEEENMDESASEDLNVPKKTNIYELNEEDELNLELNEKLDKTDSKKKISEELFNSINKKLSSVESDENINIISYDSSRKSSVVEIDEKKPSKGVLERQQSKTSDAEDKPTLKSSMKSNSEENIKKPVKAVSFDEQPSRIINTTDNDSCEDLFKRIQAQRNILGEILEKQQESRERKLDECLGRRSSRQISHTEENPPKSSEESKSYESEERKEKPLDRSQSSIDDKTTPRRGSSFEVSEKLDKLEAKPENVEIEEIQTPKRGRYFEISEKTRKISEEPKEIEEKPSSRRSSLRTKSIDVESPVISESISPNKDMPETTNIKSPTPKRGLSAESSEDVKSDDVKSCDVSENVSSPKTTDIKPSTPKKDLSLESTENTSSNADKPNIIDIKRSTPKRGLSTESMEDVKPNDVKSSGVSEDISSNADKPKTTDIKSPTPKRGLSIESPENVDSNKPTKSEENKLPTPSKGISLDKSDATETPTDQVDSETLKITSQTPQKGNEDKIDKLQKKEEIKLKFNEFSKNAEEQSKADIYDNESASKKDNGEQKFKRVPTERSSTLESVPDLSTDEEKSSKSKRSSIAEENFLGEKGEYPRVLSGMDKDIDTYETLSAEFEVQGYGVPRPKVTWYKDGEELIESKHFVMTEDGDKYKIQILDLKACDGGVYTAKLENSIGETTQQAKLNVSNVENLRGPKVKEKLKATTVTKKQKAVMKAVFIADPVPDAKWTVDGNDVNAEFNVHVKEMDLGLKECTYTMTIPSSELSDTGTYKIKVTNKFESAESSASLTIVMEPEIEIFRDLVVPPTMPCTFEVIVKSTPEAKITWFANGKQIEAGKKFRMALEKLDEYKTIHRLSIEDCSLPDEGEYKIVAKNKVGQSNQAASLKLYTEKPSFIKLLEDRTVQDYDLLQLKVRINGLPQPEVKWFKNGKEIESDDHLKIEISEEGQLSTSLTIDHFGEADVAEYKITAKNIVGEIETSSKLTLAQIEPSFGEQLKRVTDVNDGEPLEISTKVIGSPIPIVEWFKDGEPIKPEHERIKTSITPSGAVKLTIDKVDLDDCGAYKAVATNPLGKSIANTAVVVNQAPKKPYFVKNLTDINVIEGKPIKLEVQVAGFPEPKIKWLKDGHTLHPCPQIDFVCGPNSTYGLIIERSTLPDVGQYSAVISNKCGEETSNGIVRITPADKAPIFQTQLQPTKVVEGYPAKLEVKVAGFPVPKLTWKFNGNPIKIDNENFKVVQTPEGGHCLLIEKVTPGNSGEYELVATNDIGENSTTAQLTVASRSNSEVENEKPVFLHGLRDTTVDESSALSISAPFRGNPIPDVQWFKDGSLLLPNERIHFTCDGYKVGLEIQDVNMSDMGFYSCALKNPYGEDSTAAHIGVRKLYQAPVFTQRFKHLQQVPKHDAKFHCRVTGIPFPSIMWHRNGLPISNSDKFQIRRDGDVCCLTVFNVNQDDEGLYSCIASNRDGTATCEAQLQVVDKIDATPKQEPPQFMKKIGDCEIYAGMTAKFTACASGWPEPEYEWFLDNIRLHPSDRLEMEKEGSGLVRLKIIAANPDLDTGNYRLRAFNPHGEVFCDAKIIFDTGLETKYRRPVGELYRDFDKFRATGAPLPLADKPIISKMTDRQLTLSWKPSIPISPREPVTYLVEMEEQPNGKWFTARAGIRSCACDIHNLKPFVDYKFRVRVENNYGISEPSPFAITYREKLEPDPPKIRTHLPPGVVFHPDTAHYFPKDFDIERPPHDNYAQAPRFLRQEYDTQYGVKGHNANLFWFVYGYPKPKMTFYFNDELIEMGGRYDSSYTRNGQATLFINKMLERDVGIYEAVAVNEHGTARQRVQLKIAEYPEFLKRPEETFVPLRKTCRLEARVIGVPYPEIKWYKDWQPLAPSSRIQIDQVEPDLCILRITDLIMKDEGLYSISARNIAGSISTSVYLHVEESDYDTIVGGKKGEVKTRNKRFDDIYDLGDELGRGTQGIVFHAVERNTGKNLAAKVMHGTGDTRKWMSNELDIMNHFNHRNIIRPYDSLITTKSFTIIEELASGGELLDVLTRKTYITEYEISTYIRQLLWALDHMHELNIAHLGLTPGDLLISHPGGDQLKLTDFGLSRRINSRKLEPLFYGMPEYVAPEVAGGEGVNLSADLWSVGVITHLLLTGISLFRGKDDVDTLERIKEGRFSLNTDISEDARDFIIKLIMMNPNNRMDVRTALNHRWIKMAEKLRPPENSRQINTENLRNYYNLYKDWYNSASCSTWFRRRPFESAYKHPSRLIYPPGLRYTPAPSPEPQNYKDDQGHEHKSWKDRIPSREPLDIDIGLIKNESHYQYGPDTYLLQLRDVDFPVRLREYMKVAKSTSDHIDWKAPVIRERRRFMDVMDEEIDDEQKARINQYGSADIYTLRRLKQELGARPTAHVEAEAILGSRIDGLPPFFREKPQTLPVEIDKPAELICYTVGSPKPLVQWFKNDLVVTENHRTKIFEDNEGRSILRISPANEFDLGIYKVVARNKFGQTVARARMVLASEPGAPEPPEICDSSDTEVLLKWKQPKEDGNTPVLCYGLQLQENDNGKWKTIAENIDHEAWLVHDLVPGFEYQFRLLAMNKIGWSIPGYPSQTVKTKLTGVEKLIVPHVLRNMQIVCEKGKEIIGDEPRTVPDYTLEHKHLQWSEQPSEDKYRFISEIARGRFSIIVKGINSTNSDVIVAKLMETNSKTEPEIDREFEVYRMMRHERIAYLIEAFKLQFSSVAIFIMEKLQGADILTYLTSRHNYTEQMIATIITQVLDGLQYLHWKGYCHLNLQPDNIVMASVRSLQIKLIDFSCAQHVNKLGTVVMNKGPLEYSAPEILCEEPAFQYSDIWSVGVLAYILLSGVSPFKGITELETRQNITFVRYRFEHLYKELSQEALRFLMLLFKRTPTKRPSAEECHEHRWLLPTEYMIKKREKTSFDTAKLKKFSNEYHSTRNAEVTKSRELFSVIGSRIERSNSIVEELEISNTSH